MINLISVPKRIPLASKFLEFDVETLRLLSLSMTSTLSMSKNFPKQKQGVEFQHCKIGWRDSLTGKITKTEARSWRPVKELAGINVNNWVCEYVLSTKSGILSGEILNIK